MAYGALDSLRKTIEKITLNQDQYSISINLKQQIRSIHEQVIFLQEFANESPEEVNCLEEKMRDAANEAEAVIEHFVSDKILCRFRFNRCVAQFGECKSNFKQQLQKIREEIDSIAGEVMEMEKNRNTIEGEEQFNNKINDVVGLDDDLVAIKSRLCDGSPKLQVIPIVRMGGIGKTTLARNVYNDPLTLQHFDIRVWITVSQDYCIGRMCSSIMDFINKDFNINGSGQSDELEMYQSLKGRRYLIVMDDVWTTNVWDDVRNLFPNDHNESRIMITTRLFDVAAYFDSHSPLHEMCLLSIDQSWDLLRQRVFVNEEACSLELEKVGKKIASSCRGLPLAVVVIAGLLSRVEKSSDSWGRIAKNVSSIVVAKDRQFTEILSLSYTNLPHHLKSCFLYMGCFPEDHEIRSSKLVKLWAAEGFLRPLEGTSKSLEEEAEECLDDLVNRNLVLITKRKSNGKIKSCSLHDLIRDYCIRIAHENKFCLGLTDTYFEKASFIQSMTDMNCIIRRDMRHLSCIHHATISTIICLKTKHRCCMSVSVKLDFLSVKMLKVLDGENVDVESLPNELFELFQLRYLAIRSMHGFTIPAAISKLQNLQTLIINASDRWKLIGRPNVECLPQEIWMMPQLKHLICYGWMPYPKKTTCALENLQTLSLVMHEVCVEGILEKIPNIRKLGIDCFYYDYGTHLNNLESLQKLESLKLQGADWRKDSISFPRMLRKLSLCNMALPWSEMSIVGSLPNLQVLKLRDFACMGSTWETSEGEFPQLEFLQIKTSKLQHWISDEYHFPRLKFLLLHECWCLNEIPEGIGEIATLELIDVRGHTHPVPKSLADSAKRIQNEQRSLGNDTLQVVCEESYLSLF